MIYYIEELINVNKPLNIPSGDVPYYVSLKFAYNYIIGEYNYGDVTKEKLIVESFNNYQWVKFGKKSGKIYNFKINFDNHFFLINFKNQLKNKSTRFKNNFIFHEKILEIFIKKFNSQ